MAQHIKDIVDRASSDEAFAKELRERLLQLPGEASCADLEEWRAVVRLFAQRPEDLTRLSCVGTGSAARRRRGRTTTTTTTLTLTVLTSIVATPTTTTLLTTTTLTTAA